MKLADPDENHMVVGTRWTGHPNDPNAPAVADDEDERPKRRAKKEKK